MEDMSMRTIIFLVGALVVSTLASSRADAASWLTPGAGCTPNSSTVEEGIYSTFQETVQFKAGSVGLIVLNCPVTPGEGVVEGDGFFMDLYYTNPDGNDQDAFMTAVLRAMNLRTGATTNVCAVTHSDSDPSETGYQSATNPCDHRFDPNSFLYYAEVFLGRNTANTDLAFHGLSLFGGP
jgi:hypothetical protein